MLIKDQKVRSTLVILDRIKSFAFNEHSWIDDLVSVIGKMDTLANEITEPLLLFLHLVSSGDNIKERVDLSKVELLLGYIKSLIGENPSKWGYITEDIAILVSEIFRVTLKSTASINYRPLIINWALFFTLSNSDSVTLLFHIFRLTEQICSEPQSEWLNLKDNRDELFYQALALFVTSPEEKMNLEPYRIAWGHLTHTVKLIPEKVLLESSYYGEVFLPLTIIIRYFLLFILNTMKFN